MTNRIAFNLDAMKTSLSKTQQRYSDKEYKKSVIHYIQTPEEGNFKYF